MTRGDIVTVAASGDYGKPRPAVIAQSDAIPEFHAPAVVCQLTSEVVEAPSPRVTLDPSPGNGLRMCSQIMVDNPVTIRRTRVGNPIGRLDPTEVQRLNVALAFVMGLAD